MVVSSGWAIKLTILLHLVPRLRITGAIPPLPSVCLHGVDWENFSFSYLNTYARAVPQIRPYHLSISLFSNYANI
jgi:hypothetical protein